MTCCEVILAVLRYPFISAVNFPAVVGVLVLTYIAASLSWFAWKSFRSFVLARYFPQFFGLELKSAGSWAGKFRDIYPWHCSAT
jgi:hypothetical protein